jgi:phosphoglycolate phosphatase
LVDTAPDLAKTLNTLLQRAGLEPVPYGDVKSMIGDDGAESDARTCAASAVNVDVSAAELDRLFDDFIEHYAAHIAGRLPAVSGTRCARSTSACR